MNDYGFIYMTHNLVNGKRYIGKRKYDAAGRWVDYLGSGVLLSRAIQKYGKENFRREIIDIATSNEELSEKEKYWIGYYDATQSKDFYNVASGGDGGNVRAGYTKEQFELSERKRIDAVRRGISRGEHCGASKLTECDVQSIICELLSGQYLTDVAHKYGVAVETVRDIRNHKAWTHLTNDIIFPKVDGRNNNQCCAKRINAFDKQMNFVGSFSSAREAEKELGVGYRLISQVCNGVKKSAHGYIFQFAI